MAVHLKMTGRLYLVDADKKVPSHTHLVFTLRAPSRLEGDMESRSKKGSRLRSNNKREDSGHSQNDEKLLSFSDARKFGFVQVLPTEEVEQLAFIQKLGKEPLKDLTLADFQKILAKSSRPIKNLLLDQQKIAGIGNIYACEALWIAGISPQQKANSLHPKAMKKLFEAIEDVLTEGITRGGASDNSYRNLMGGKGKYQNFFKVYGRTGKPCPRCGTPVQRVSLGGRGTFYCSQCQKE